MNPSTKRDVELLRSTDAAYAFVAQVAEKYGEDGLIGFDIETEVNDPAPPNQIGRLVAYSIHGESRDGSSSDTAVIWVPDVDAAKVLEPLVDVCVIGHNLSFDLIGVRQHTGVALRKVCDTMLAYQLMNLGRRRFYVNLAQLVEMKLGEKMTGKGDVRLSFRVDEEPTPEQVEYAADDTRLVVAVWRVLERELEELGLDTVFSYEMGAAPALAEMTTLGIPFDADRWRREVLAEADKARRAHVNALLELTGGNISDQGTLFAAADIDTGDAVSDADRLGWNPDSEVDVRNILNRLDRENLVKLFPGRADMKEVLTRSDAVDKQLLGKLIKLGSPVATEIRGYRDAIKLLSTYGEKMLELRGYDQRFHPSYNQCDTDTGRLASSKPNAQNYHPKMKYYITAGEGYYFGLADFSQEELRIGAVTTGDPDMIRAYREGIDLHSLTASKLMGLTYEEFIARHEAGDAEADRYRKIAKTTNFGTYYGVGPSALSNNLAGVGVEVPRDEAAEMLANWFKGFPYVKEWADGRDKVVADFAAEAPRRADWSKTVALDEDIRLISKASAAIRKETGAPPGLSELVERTGLPAERILQCWEIDQAVVVDGEGKPLEFHSETKAGRRRYFRASTDFWYTNQAVSAFCGSNSKPSVLLREFRTYLKDLSNQAASGSAEASAKLKEIGNNTRSLFGWIKPTVRKDGVEWVSPRAVERAFSNKEFKRLFVAWLWEKWPRAADRLREKALTDTFLRMTNAFRNHPIQGGGADVMLLALTTLWPELRDRYPDAYLVQTVHDSLVLAAPAEVIADVTALAASHMTAAFHTIYGDEVPMKVDWEVSPSLSEKEKVDLESLAETSDDGVDPLAA